MLTVHEALELVLRQVSLADGNMCALTDSLHRVLCEDLVIPHDSPPFDKSMMDGFGVRASDFADAGSRDLTVIETITAGQVPVRSVQPGMAAQIMTGALIPAGVDCVVPIERVQYSADRHSADRPDRVVVSADTVAVEQNILRQGCLSKAGTELMPRGTVLEPQHLAVLAEFGVANVPVYRQPRVAVLATGDELLAVDQPLLPGRIRNSNEPMLVAQTRRAHAVAVPLGIARDNRDDLKRRIAEGLQNDFLLLSGGVSAGTLDLVPSELKAAGVEQVFHKIDMKPGKPLWFGCLKSASHTCWVFGLPGNPVSSMICFELFVRPAIRQFSGWFEPRPVTIAATLTQQVSITGDRPTYFPCTLQPTEHGFAATPVAWGGSADLRTTSQANGMCLLMPRPEPYPAGHKTDSISWT